MDHALYGRYWKDGKRVLPAYNLFGELVHDTPVARYCEAGKRCDSLLQCGVGYCDSTGQCSNALPTVNGDLNIWRK
jgi:hypothetical protein